MKDNVVFEYKKPLKEAVIKRRKSQFTIDVVFDDEVLVCHCPTTGRIGNIDLAGIPCLLSESNDPKRKTPCTVEAVSLDLPTSREKSWIGINQNAANRYVENALVKGSFHDIVSGYDTVLREQALGNSKLDFLVGNTYIESKLHYKVSNFRILNILKRNELENLVPQNALLSILMNLLAVLPIIREPFYYSVLFMITLDLR